MWSGAVTSGSARIRARVTIDGPVRLDRDARRRTRRRVAAHARARRDRRRPTASTPSTPTACSPTPRTATRSRRRPAATSAPATSAPSPTGRSRSRFAFGSCATTGSSNAIFDVIRRRSPHFFLHLGDFHYANIAVDDPWRFRDALEPRAALAAPVGALSRGADRLRLRRPRLRPRRCRRHVGDEGRRRSASTASACPTIRCRCRRCRPACPGAGPHRPDRPGVHGRPRPRHRHRHPVGADAAALRPTPPAARCWASRSGSGSSTS